MVQGPARSDALPAGTGVARHPARLPGRPGGRDAAPWLSAECSCHLDSTPGEFVRSAPPSASFPSASLSLCLRQRIPTACAQVGLFSVIEIVPGGPVLDYQIHPLMTTCSSKG